MPLRIFWSDKSYIPRSAIGLATDPDWVVTTLK
jgi:hypothetical protein